MNKIYQFVFPLFEEDEQRVKTRETLRGCCVRVISTGTEQAINEFKDWAVANLVEGSFHHHLFHMHLKGHPEVQGLIEIAVI